MISGAVEITIDHQSGIPRPVNFFFHPLSKHTQILSKLHDSIVVVFSLYFTLLSLPINYPLHNYGNEHIPLVSSIFPPLECINVCTVE